MGCRRVPANTGLGLQRDRGDPATAPGPAPAHHSPINVEVDPRRGRPAFKMSSKPGTGHVLEEMGTVSIAGTERSARRAAPARLTRSPSQTQGEETELPFPDMPGATSKSTSEEEVSSQPTHAEAPTPLRKVK